LLPPRRCPYAPLFRSCALSFRRREGTTTTVAGTLSSIWRPCLPRPRTGVSMVMLTVARPGEVRFLALVHDDELAHHPLVLVPQEVAVEHVGHRRVGVVLEA